MLSPSSQVGSAAHWARGVAQTMVEQQRLTSRQVERAGQSSILSTCSSPSAQDGNARQQAMPSPAVPPSPEVPAVPALPPAALPPVAPSPEVPAVPALPPVVAP